MPPPVDEADPATNRQPTIDPQQVDARPVTLSCNTPTQFFANLNDPDIDDTLYWRFFIDYYRASADDLRATDDDVTAIPPRRGAARGVIFGVAATDATIQERPSDVHVVELLVADREFDRPFDEDTANDNSGLIGRVAITPGLTASYVWTINPVDCP